jgi:hypothetical protein
LASVIGLVITAIYTGYAIQNSNWSVDFKTVVVTMAAVNLLLALFAIYSIGKHSELHIQIKEANDSANVLKTLLGIEKDKLADSEYRRKKLAIIYHNFSHEFRSATIKIHEMSVSGLNAENIEYVNRFHNFITFAIANIKEIFDILTHDECCVCLKLVNVDDEDDYYYVETLKRDAISNRERSSIDMEMNSYRAVKNTAFKNILDEDCPDSYFISNDLGSEKGYLNANRNWQIQYNATLVVPIRLRHDEEGCYSVMGFLCVDNFAGGFDEVCVNTLSAFADLLYDLFDTVYLGLEEQAPQTGLEGTGSAAVANQVEP